MSIERDESCMESCNHWVEGCHDDDNRILECDAANNSLGHGINKTFNLRIREQFKDFIVP